MTEVLRLLYHSRDIPLTKKIPLLIKRSSTITNKKIAIFVLKAIY